MTPNNYVLIDFENVQPNNLEILKKHPFTIFVFVGENQAKIPFGTAKALQEFGKEAKYIKISGNGPNALDFHIACYLGQLSSQDNGGYYYIVSKDKGFDPLITSIGGEAVCNAVLAVCRSRIYLVDDKLDLRFLPWISTIEKRGNDGRHVSLDVTKFRVYVELV